MMKKIILATIISLALMTGLATAAPPNQQYFRVVAAGEFTGDENSKAQHIKRTTDQIWFQPDQTAGDLVWFTLSGALLSGPFDRGRSGDVCFPDKTYKGSLLLTETDEGYAMATFWFTAKTDPGAGGIPEDVKYRLQLTALDGWEDPFIPTDGNPTVMTATDWEMGTEGKGKLTRIACTGDGNDLEVVIGVERIL